jgi:hypothetical protein
LAKCSANLKTSHLCCASSELCFGLCTPSQAESMAFCLLRAFVSPAHDDRLLTAQGSVRAATLRVLNLQLLALLSLFSFCGPTG